MIYLKSFNESYYDRVLSFLDEVKNFCELHLANLLDNSDVRLKVMDDGNNTTPQHTATIVTSFRKPISWEYIKTHWVPFLHYLKSEYTIISNDNVGYKIWISVLVNDDRPGYRGNKLNWEKYKIEDLENIELPDISSILCHIRIEV